MKAVETDEPYDTEAGEPIEEDCKARFCTADERKLLDLVIAGQNTREAAMIVRIAQVPEELKEKVRKAHIARVQAADEYEALWNEVSKIVPPDGNSEAWGKLFDDTHPPVHKKDRGPELWQGVRP